MSIQPKFFTLFKNNDDINQGLSDEFISIIKKCNNPYIICIYGNARMGKSTKLNQIINGTQNQNYFNLSKPFKTKLQIHTTETKGCNFYGPLTLNELCIKNDIDINEFDKNIFNSEFFIVDTEGLNTIDHTTKTFIAGILTLLQIASIKILYIPLLDNQKFEEISKTAKLSNILKSGNNNFLVGETLVLIRDVPLKEDNNENLIRKEIEEQKEEFQNKINGYMNKINGKPILCEILPNYDLAKNKNLKFDIYYKEQMQSLVYTIFSNIKYNPNINGKKIIELIKNFLEIFKEVKNIESLKNTENALNSILLNVFKRKLNKIYNNVKNKFILKILHMENNKEDIKKYLINELKKEINNIWELYNETIKNEINNELDKYSLELRNDIINFIMTKKDEFDSKINNFLNFEKNIQLKQLINQYQFCEQINSKEMDNKINKVINGFIINNTGFIQCLSMKEKYKQGNLSKYLKDSIYNNLKFIINSRPKWRDYLIEKINEIKTNITEPFINELLENNNIKELKFYYETDLYSLKEQIQVYISNNNYTIYKQNEYNDELNKIFKVMKEKIHYKILTKERSIDDGIYYISPLNCENKVLQYTSSDLEISDFNNESYQKFEIKYENNCYTIRFINTNEYLLSGKNNITKTSKIDCKEQHWFIVLIDNCFFEIISEKDGNLLTIENTNNGSKVVCAPKTGQLNQKFNFEPTNYSPPEPPKKNDYIPPPPPPPPVNYFPIPNFHPPYTNQVSIVDALKSIGVDSSQNYRRLIGDRNQIPGVPFSPNYNITMLAKLKAGQLIIP